MKILLLCFLLLWIFPALAQVHEAPLTEEFQTLDSLLTLEILTPSKYWKKASESPASVTTVTSADIERFGFRTFEDVLATVRSFYTTYDRNYTYVGVRGFSRPSDYNNRLLLLLNGHTVNENFYGTAPFGTDFALDLSTVDRIEIVRGPGSVLYGSGAFFAVINVITKKGNTLDGGRISTRIGSYGLRQVVGSYGKEFRSGADIHIAASLADAKGQDLYFKEFDTGSTNKGIATGIDWDRYGSFVATFSYKDIAVQGLLTSREKGIPTASYETRFNDSRARTLDEYGLVEIKYHAGLGVGKDLMARAYADYYHYEGTYPYDFLTMDATDGRRYGTELQAQWDLSTVYRFTAGIEYVYNARSDYRNWSPTTILFDGDFPFSIFSLYIQGEQQVLKNLSITFGLRRDGYSDVGSMMAPRLGIVFTPSTSSTLKFLYGEAFRAPNNYEQHYSDPLAGYKSNRTLQPETIRTAEIILEQHITDAVHASLSIYENQMSDLIDQRVDPKDSLIQFRNINSARSYGIETELTTWFSRCVRGFTSYSYQYAYKPGHRRAKLTNSPSHLVKLGVWVSLSNALRVGCDAHYTSERITVYKTTTPSAFVTNLIVTGNIQAADEPTMPGWWRYLRLSLRINNVFNQRVVVPGGFDHRQDGIPQDGRNFSLLFDWLI